MGLLRACAEAVIVAGGTFRATPNHKWTADHIFPALADAFDRLRRDDGCSAARGPGSRRHRSYVFLRYCLGR
jgi:hypothetical protein